MKNSRFRVKRILERIKKKKISTNWYLFIKLEKIIFLKNLYHDLLLTKELYLNKGNLISNYDIFFQCISTNGYSGDIYFTKGFNIQLFRFGALSYQLMIYY